MKIVTKDESYALARDLYGNEMVDEQGKTFYRRMVNMPGEVILLLEPGSVQHLRARAIAKGKTAAGVGLILNGSYIKGAAMRPDPMDLKEAGDVVRFTIAYRDDDSKTLNKILVEQGAAGVSLSVGFDDGEMMHSDLAIDILPAVSDNRAFLALAILLTVLFYFMTTRSKMLREPGQGVSLGRTQMAWWTLLASWSFLYLYNFSGSLALTKSVVVLMGISSATALAAVFIDKRKAEQQSPAAAVPAGAAPAPAVELPGRLTLKQFSRALLADPTDPSQGLSMHRAQVVLWTVVMSYVFLESVVGKYVMPEFDNTLLALMGVSSGTYLGFKVPEKTPTPAAPAPVAPAPAPGPSPSAAPASPPGPA